MTDSGMICEYELSDADDLQGISSTSVFRVQSERCQKHNTPSGQQGQCVEIIEKY